MLKRMFSGFLVFSLLLVVAGEAQGPSDKPVWTMELIKVKPGMFGFTLGYLDDNWYLGARQKLPSSATLN